MVDAGSLEDKMMQMIRQKVSEQAEEIDALIKYDAMVEGIDLSEISVTVEETSNSEFQISFDLGDLNDWYKHLARDIYFQNALKRRT